jgi:hypothetical protein
MLASHFLLTGSTRRSWIAGTPSPSSIQALFRLSLLIAVAGCSNRPGAIRPPDVDANDAAATIIEELDRDGDGKLAQAEWTSSPVVAAVATNYDKNADRFLESAEIVAGIAQWQTTGVGARSVPFRVIFNGAPLVGATVTLVPADFLGDAVKPATATTGPGGGGQLALAREDLPKNAPNMPLMQPGLYRVEITHPSIKVPAKYNTETTLGIEISSANPGPEGALWSIGNK